MNPSQVPAALVKAVWAPLAFGVFGSAAASALPGWPYPYTTLPPVTLGWLAIWAACVTALLFALTQTAWAGLVYFGLRMLHTPIAFGKSWMLGVTVLVSWVWVDVFATVVLPRVMAGLGTPFPGAWYFPAQIALTVVAVIAQIRAVHYGAAAAWWSAVLLALIASPLTYYALFVVSGSASDLAKMLWSPV